jgi:hypothetical protein
MPDWIRYVVTEFGILFFSGHLVWMVCSFRFARLHADRLEYVGVIVPGSAGIMIAASPWVSYPPLAIALCLAGLLVIVVGRGLYELVHRVVRKANDA